MRFVHEHGGKAIFVHQPFQNDHFQEYIDEIYNKLNKENIVDHTCVADYTTDSELYHILERK